LFVAAVKASNEAGISNLLTNGPLELWVLPTIFEFELLTKAGMAADEYASAIWFVPETNGSEMSYWFPV
jgi:hypothetical protein